MRGRCQGYCEGRFVAADRETGIAARAARRQQVKFHLPRIGSGQGGVARQPVPERGVGGETGCGVGGGEKILRRGG